MNRYANVRKITVVAIATLVSGAGLTGFSASSASAQTYKGESLHVSSVHLPAGNLFDDFDYRSVNEKAITRHGWAVRTASGSPGVEGARWTRDNISFPRVNGHKSLQLQLTTDGTSTGTTESEFAQTDNAVREGTYLARIKFSDSPVRGSNGDHLNETFFAISPSASSCDTKYSETDFSEYLPNGGWGTPGALNSETTWYTPGDNCSDSVENDQAVSLTGWHAVMATISGGHVRYYVDGQLVADHSGKYYPRQDMALDFNMWLIDLTGHNGSKKSLWHEDIDYVYYAQNQVLTLNQARFRIDLLRFFRIHYINTVR